MTKNWVPSRYNRHVRLNGKGSMLYNSFTGAIASIDPEEEANVRALLEIGEGAAESAESGEELFGEPSELAVEPSGESPTDSSGELSWDSLEEPYGESPEELLGESQEEPSRESHELAAALRDAGFLVPAGTDELRQAAELHQSLKEAASMHLVLMPTEACNFRCTYCYQTFPRGAMSRETIDGLKAYVQDAAKRIEHLSISWFGGEPLLAPGIVTELSDSFLASCRDNGISYSADMSTNGYFLTKELFAELLKREVRRFMITLDGVGEAHDRRRKHRDGGGTYDRIIGNLMDIRELEADFKIDLRVNFDEDNLGAVPELLERLSAGFRGDGRFQILVRPVGRWGGPQDDRIPVCDRTAADAHLWDLTEAGLEYGLPLSEAIADSMLPSGSVCYAAKPNSLVIGSNGRLHKCSIALDEEINQVGQLYGDGSLKLDADKVSLWTDGGEEQDAVCRSCFYRPACQGNHCPLYRMRTGKRPCPHEKRKIKRVLNLLWKNEEYAARRLEGGERGDETDPSGSNTCTSDEVR